MSSVGPPVKNQDCILTSINDLPVNLIQYMVNRMPLRDAIRTSVLSKEWSYQWKSLSRLMFDHQFFESIQWHNTDRRDRINILDKVLLSQNCPIHELHFYFPYWGWEHICRADIVRDLIQFADRNGVEKLGLVLACLPFEVPDCLFSCLKLTHLSLTLFRINPPLSFSGFPRLVSLRLGLKGDLDKIDRLISTCPELRKLYLGIIDKDDSGFPEPTCFSFSAPKLETFIFINHVPYQLFYLRSRGPNTNIRRISLGGRYYLKKGVEFSYTVEFFTSVYNIEKLDLSFSFWKVFSHVGDIPRVLPSLLLRLKTLNLNGGSCLVPCDSNQILFALCLIRSSPNLEKLHLCVKTESCHHVPEIADIHSLGRLRIVNVSGVTGPSMDLKVIKFLLECSPVLEEMSIEPYGKLGVSEMDQLTMKLLQFRRASSKAKISFSETSALKRRYPI